MKKLKQLKLKKQTVVNLNDSEMKQIQGGNIWTVSPYLPEAYSIGVAIYEYGQGQSYWNCQPQTTVSEVWVWVGNDQCCQIPDVDVYGMYSVYP